MAVTCNHCGNTWEPKIRPGQRAILCSKCHYPVRLTKTPLPTIGKADDEFIHSELMVELMSPTPIPTEQLPLPPSPPMSKEPDTSDSEDLAPATQFQDLDEETELAKELHYCKVKQDGIHDEKTPLDYTLLDGTQVLELDKETTDVCIEAAQLEGMIGELLDEPVADFHDEHTSFIRVQDSTLAETVIRPVEQDRYDPEEDVTLINKFPLSPSAPRVLPPDQTMVMQTDGKDDRQRNRGDIHAEGTHLYSAEDIEAMRTEIFPSKQKTPGGR